MQRRLADQLRDEARTPYAAVEVGNPKAAFDETRLADLDHCVPSPTASAVS